MNQFPDWPRRCRHARNRRQQSSRGCLPTDANVFSSTSPPPAARWRVYLEADVSDPYSVAEALVHGIPHAPTRLKTSAAE
jgi:hypothetical protein